MLKSLIVRKEFLNQHNRDTLKPAEVEKQAAAFRQLQSYGAGILESVFTNLRPGDSVNTAKETSRYEYRFVVDGEDWIADDDADDFVPNPFGGKNSVVVLNGS